MIPLSGNAHQQGLLDTNILFLHRWINPAELPNEMAISAITLAELSAGPHEVRRNDEHVERARRLDVLQRAENEFDPIPTAGYPRSRKIFPCSPPNPEDFKGPQDLLTVVTITRPQVPHESS